MQKTFMQKVNRWLLPAVLILFIAQVAMLPWAVGFAWADRSDTPTHTVTYTPNKLEWDSATGINANGSAELNLFYPEYEGVKSHNGNNVIAPGTENSAFIRLKNECIGHINYTAVLYEIKSDSRIPVNAVLTVENAAEAEKYKLPEGVTEEDVIRVVTGRVERRRFADFDISWLWPFDESEQQNTVDTLLATQGHLPEVTVGFYIVVEDPNRYGSDTNEDNRHDYDDNNPNTGGRDDIIFEPTVPQEEIYSHMGAYLGLMLVSFILLIILLWERKREKDRENR